MGMFGKLGGEPAMVTTPSGSAPLWLQNAGFFFVPFIALSAFASWFGMNDIASAKASFSEQAVIFERRHNWIIVLALHRHLRLVHRLFRRFPAALQDAIP